MEVNFHHFHRQWGEYLFLVYTTQAEKLIATSGLKSNFICDNILTKSILFFFSCSEVNSTWLIIVVIIIILQANALI